MMTSAAKGWLSCLLVIVFAVESTYAQEVVVLDENVPYKRIGRSVYFVTDPKRELQIGRAHV